MFDGLMGFLEAGWRLVVDFYSGTGTYLATLSKKDEPVKFGSGDTPTKAIESLLERMKI